MAGLRRSRRRRLLVSRWDRVIVILMVAVPTSIVMGLVWFPALVTVVLSFTNWSGIGGLETISFVGLQNYVDVTTIYPPFRPALQNNVAWLVFFFVGPTIFGIVLAAVLDREVRGTRLYASSFYLPVVLSLALVGFIWQLIYSRDQGLLNDVLSLWGVDRIDW
jgi:multiple sugar transport system permease protein